MKHEASSQILFVFILGGHNIIMDLLSFASA